MARLVKFLYEVEAPKKTMFMGMNFITPLPRILKCSYGANHPGYLLKMQMYTFGP